MKINDAKALRFGAFDVLRVYLAGALAWVKPSVVPVVRAFTTANTGSVPSNTKTILVPAGTVAGDLLVLIVGTRGNLSQTIAPNDVAQVIQQARGTSGNMRVLWKIATGNETQWTVTWAGTASTQTLMALRISGHSPTAPINVSAGVFQSSTTATAQSAPGVTPSVGSTLVLRALLMAVSTSTPPTMAWDSPATEVAYTATSQGGSNGNGALSLATEPGPTQGETVPVRAVTSSAPQGSAGVTIAIAPA